MLPLLLLTAAPQSFTTLAEQSGYTRTGRYEEVEALCAELAARYTGKVKCETFGTTPLGRKMLYLAASADGVLTPEAVKKKARPLVLLQGGIHAGEIDGKDAGFALLRDLLEGKVGAGVLSRLTLVFVPVFNVDGHERFGPNNRPNQRGPQEMGWRVTASNLNLNRDYAKAEAPEMQAMLKLLNAFDPIVYGDLHVTDGAKFQPDVSVIIEPRQTGPDALCAIARGLEASLMSDLKAKGHLSVDFYPQFIKDDDPASGFSAGMPPPRLSDGYWPLHNRFAMLVETHSWKPYGDRVKATYDTCLSLLTHAAESAPLWLAAARQADEADSKRTFDGVALAWENDGHAIELEFPGYAYTREDSPISGAKWVRYDETKPQPWKVPFFDRLRPSMAAKVPKGGYVVPPAHAGWVAEKLKLHGLRFSVLDHTLSKTAVESFRVVEAKFKPAPYEGRQVAQVKGEWAADVRDLPKGSLYVPAAQPHVALLMALLEPTAPDSFMSWGYFNAHLEQKEYMEPYIAEEIAREQLKDPKVKADFEARLKADPAFAKSPEERLKFFYARHKSFDDQLNLYPVLRVESAP
jgi:hypothetical protein